MNTSTIETRTADIIANEWPAENVGGPHCRGYGNMNLYNHEKKPKKLPKVLNELGEMKLLFWGTMGQ
jgi:hypothetical protein